MRGLVAELGSLPAGDITILDMEASIEHLSRGTLRSVDTLVFIAEPYYRSLETLGRMAPLAQDLGIAWRVVVANKVRNDQDLAAIKEYCARLDLPIIGSVPFDEAVVEADRAGRALVDFAPTAPAIQALEGIASELLDARPAPAGAAEPLTSHGSNGKRSRARNTRARVSARRQV